MRDRNRSNATGDSIGGRAGLVLGLSFLLLLESIFSTAHSQPTKVNVASSGISPTQLPPYMAQDAGTFAKNRLDVSIIRTRPEIAVMSLLGGEASIIHIGGAVAIRSNLRGADLVFIAAGAVATDIGSWVQRK